MHAFIHPYICTFCTTCMIIYCHTSSYIITFIILYLFISSHIIKYHQASSNFTIYHYMSLYYISSNHDKSSGIITYSPYRLQVHKHIHIYRQTDSQTVRQPASQAGRQTDRQNIHYITLPYITLHYLTLPYITLHYITCIRTHTHT